VRPSLLSGAVQTELEAGQRVMRKVVNISSVAGLFGNAGRTNLPPPRPASRVTMTLAKEWGPERQRELRGIRLIKTRLTNSAPMARPPISKAAISR
jgi:3-oxoacyl-[acyl-carrier protein] reductase